MTPPVKTSKLESNSSHGSLPHPLQEKNLVLSSVTTTHVPVETLNTSTSSPTITEDPNWEAAFSNGLKKLEEMPLSSLYGASTVRSNIFVWEPETKTSFTLPSAHRSTTLHAEDFLVNITISGPTKMTGRRPTHCQLANVPIPARTAEHLKAAIMEHVVQAFPCVESNLPTRKRKESSS